jgi:hypothetical protein
MSEQLQKMKQIGMGFVAGAIVLLIVIFATGWVVTSSSAQEKAEEKAEQAVNNRLAQICLYQFKQSQDIDKYLKELEDVSSWNRPEYVAKHGWATMPDSDSPNEDVADVCSEMIMKIEK